MLQLTQRGPQTRQAQHSTLQQRTCADARDAHGAAQDGGQRRAIAQNLAAALELAAVNVLPGAAAAHCVQVNDLDVWWGGWDEPQTPRKMPALVVTLSGVTDVKCTR